MGSKLSSHAMTEVVKVDAQPLATRELEGRHQIAVPGDHHNNNRKARSFVVLASQGASIKDE